MARHIALLRGINVGTSKRIPMARLRDVLAQAGYEDVRTLLQSGNVVLTSEDTTAAVAVGVARAIEGEWGLQVPVIMRTCAQLASVVDSDPLGDLAVDPKLYTVTFFNEMLSADALDEIDPAEYEPERFELRGAELYTWAPEGIHASRLMRRLARATAMDDIIGTTRNWNSITKLLELASD